MSPSSAEARAVPAQAAPMDAGNSRAPRLFNMARVFLLATLMAAPIPYASVQTWAWGSLALMAVLILFVWGIACVQQGVLRIFWSNLYWPAGLFLLWAVIQLAGHYTVDYIGTREAVVKLATDFIFFFLAGQLWAMGSARKWGALGLTVTVYAFVIAFLAIVQFFSGPIYNYWNYWSVNSLWGAFGTYVNRNHYAGLMEMLIPLSAAYVFSHREGDPQRNLLGFAALLPIASLLLSGSRGGFISLLVEIIILGVVLFRVSLVSGRRSLLAIGALGMTGAAILFFWIDPGQISKRLEEVFNLKTSTDVSYGHRGETALDTLLILRDHPLAGIGVGSFGAAFPKYQTVAGDLVWGHAHNDFAEALAETGIIGGVMIFGALIIFFTRAFQRLTAGPRDVAEWMQLGAITGVLGLLIHSFFDFNLHIPANAAWFAVCCGIAHPNFVSSNRNVRLRSELVNQRLRPCRPHMLPNSIMGVRLSFICLVCTRLRLTRCIGILGLVATATLMGLAAALPTPLLGNCPKILMFDGLEIKAENNDSMAQYWGQKIGVEGFFVGNLMSSWDDSVGDDENSPIYQSVKAFQELYSKYGVTDNFIKVALYTKHNWRNPADQIRVISNFRQAAHLARYARLKGLALDLEAYVNGYWNEDPAIPDKGERVFALGQAIGRAVISEFPDAAIIVLPEVLTYASPPYGSGVHQAYALSSRFWDGLTQAHFRQLIIATESSYDSERPDLIARQIHDTYESSLRHNGVDPNKASISLGIWPLAKTYTDKSARISPAQFEDRLTLALIEPSPYVWIYGHGSAWQRDGPYGKGDVDPHFEEYVQVLHRMKKSCSTGGAAFHP